MNNQKGNVLFIVFMAIALAAMLVWAVSKSTEQQSSTTDLVSIDDQITRLFNQVNVLSLAVQQMIVGGQNPETLYSTLSTMTPGQAGWDTSPHGAKIYHPMGGGVKYMAATGDTADDRTVASNIKISAGSIIDKVGPTDVTVGDIVMVATISSEDACQRINKRITGATTIPVMDDAGYTALITNATTTTVDGAVCADCVGVAQICVQNTAGDAWGYYKVLLPG